MRNVLTWLMPIALTVVANQPAGAAQFRCVVVQPGDSATKIAARLTGAATHVDASWFQILDPARGVFVPKNEYGLILPGWRACLASNRADAIPVARLAPVNVAAPRPRPAEVFWRLAAMPEIWGSLWLLVTIALGCEMAASWSPSARARARAMTQFGERFLREFERPLLRPLPGDRAIESRVRVEAGQRRLDILLAPQSGRSYPNLSDHERNVRYDVARVLRAVGDERFVLEAMSARGRWVMLRYRITADARLEGDT
jgi:hypothetical protein